MFCGYVKLSPEYIIYTTPEPPLAPVRYVAPAAAPPPPPPVLAVPLAGVYAVFEPPPLPPPPEPPEPATP